MAEVIKMPSAEGEAVQYWGRYYVETPRCVAMGCGRVAREVDAFFPYIDDYNRCEHQSGDLVSGTIH